jgi:aldehyde dehydrogenase (NAD+)
VAITGETVTGRHVAQRAAAQLKPYSLELGGKNPVIILADADLEYAVKSIVFSAYLHQGEICMSTDRIIVEKPIVEAFSQALANFVSHLPVGDPSQPTTFIGPVISDKQVQKIDGHVKDAVAKGAKLLAGGIYTDRLYQPTLLADITPEMKIYYEETFGPVASIIAVDDEKQALQVANDTMYGLSAGVITKDLEKAIYLGEGLEAGMVHINDGSIDADACCPFGGCKSSGIGREGGRYSVEEMTEVKWLTIQKSGRQLPF